MARFTGWTMVAIQKIQNKTLQNSSELNKSFTSVKKTHIDYPGKICAALSAVGIDHVREYKFLEDRRFRLDIAIPAYHIAIEFEGGIFGKKCPKCGGAKCNYCDHTGRIMGGHSRGKGYAKDVKKYNLLTMHGWKLLRYTTETTREEMWEYKVAAEVRDLINKLKGE